MLGGSFSWALLAFKKPFVYFLLSSCHTNGCSWRKWCFIYETYISGSHWLLLRFKDYTHNILPMESLECTRTHTFSHTHAHMHLWGISLTYLLFSWTESQFFERDFSFPLRCSESCRLLLWLPCSCGSSTSLLSHKQNIGFKFAAGD